MTVIERVISRGPASKVKSSHLHFPLRDVRCCMNLFREAAESNCNHHNSLRRLRRQRMSSLCPEFRSCHTKPACKVGPNRVNRHLQTKRNKENEDELDESRPKSLGMRLCKVYKVEFTSWHNWGSPGLQALLLSFLPSS